MNMRYLLTPTLLVTATLLLAPTLSHAQSGGFDRAAFAAYVETQGGRNAPRFYAYSGTVYDIPSGEILATVDGYQQARVYIPDPGKTEAYIVRRAFLLYQTPDRAKTLKVYPDVRAASTAAPLSIARVKLDGDRLKTATLSGVKGRTSTNAALPETLSAAREDQAFVFRRVIVPPNPQEQPVELFETVYEAHAGAPPGIRSVMTKVANNTGFLPAGGRHMLHMIWRPIATYADLTASVRQFIEAEAPDMKNLPPTLAESFAALGVEQSSLGSKR